MNLRTIALASAMLMLLPAGAVSTSGSDVFDIWAEGSAWVTDVVLADLHEREFDPDSMHAQETLVEGHTVFAVMDLRPLERPPPGSINVTGLVECSHWLDIETRPWRSPVGDVPIPTRIERAGAQCRVGEQVVVTPSVFSESTPSPLTPTGQLIPFTTPSGVTEWATEFTFTVTEQDASGAWVAQSYYAWSTPVLPAWEDASGRPKNFWMPLPTDKLTEMGITEFDIIPERELRR